jgi:ABC-type transport system involved in cytochrome c biogenesis permease subunit
MINNGFNILELLYFLSTACYIASMTGYILFLFKPVDIFSPAKKENMEKYAFYFLSAGFFIHFATILFQSFQIAIIHLNNIEQALSIAGLAVAGGFRIFKKYFNLRLLGIFVSPIIVFVMVAVVILPLNYTETSLLVQKFWLFSHLLLIIISFLVFFLAFIAGVLYLAYDKLLLSKYMPESILDSINYIFLSIGFIMMTFGLITGFIYAEVVWGNFWSFSPYIAWSMVTWIIFSILLYTRLHFLWTGRQPAINTIISFVALSVSFLGINFYF